MPYKEFIHQVLLLQNLSSRHRQKKKHNPLDSDAPTGNKAETRTLRSVVAATIVVGLVLWTIFLSREFSTIHICLEVRKP